MKRENLPDLVERVHAALAPKFSAEDLQGLLAPLAVAERLGGAETLALMALLIALFGLVAWSLSGLTGAVVADIQAVVLLDLAGGDFAVHTIFHECRAVVFRRRAGPAKD